MGKGFAGRVAADGRPVILADVDHADVLNPILRKKGIKSLVGVPLRVRNDVIGVLHVGTLVHRAFTTADVELLSLVADRVAVAVERGRLHEQTAALEELRSNFVAIASHELRTPASAIYGIFATLAGLELTPEAREELLEVGYEQAERMRRLTEQLLDLSQLDARRVTVSPEPLVIRDALAEIVKATVPRDLHVELDVEPRLVAAVDPMVLDRILSNLLINAARYGTPPIVISAEAGDHLLRIGVEDRGPGIPEGLRPHIFERFTRSADAHGPGLGLTIARAYARIHGGELVLAPHRTAGAQFVLTVPQG